jgi:uridine kinase
MLYQPYLIGISGNSASGKTTLANLLQQLFNKQNCTVLNGDDMHKWERNHPMYKEFTHLHPKANNLYTQLQHFLAIGKGNTIERQHYNHDTGTFSKTAIIKSSKIVIFEGLHTLFFKQKKQWFDLSIYLKPEEDLRIAWKLQRDVNERGHHTDKVLSSIAERKDDETQYINIQEQYADVVISFIDANQFSINTSNIYNLEPLINSLNDFEIVLSHQFSEDRQILTLQTTASKDAIQTAAVHVSNQLEELGIANNNWQTNQNGLLQVVLCHIVFNKLNITAALNTPTI